MLKKKKMIFLGLGTTSRQNEVVKPEIFGCEDFFLEG